MIFKAKKDSYFTNIIWIILLVMAVATLWPAVYEVFFSSITDWVAVWIMCGLFIVFSGFMVWIWLDIEYYSMMIFYLFVVVFCSRIHYIRLHVYRKLIMFLLATVFYPLKMLLKLL